MPQETSLLWDYRARAVKIVDGDTLDLVIDQGLHTYRIERVRLLGVNTPELHASDPAVRSAAQEAMAFTAQWLNAHLHGLAAQKDGWPLLVRIEKSDVFGRWLAEVSCVQGHSLTQDLLAQGNPPWERKDHA